MVRKGVRVCVRTRPSANFAQEQLLVDPEASTIKVVQRHGDEGDHLDNRRDRWQFRFNSVLHNAGQDTLYEELGREVVDGCLDGINGTVMAYGQTGAGKTFTMIGDTTNYKHRGIVPRALAHLFAEIAERESREYRVKVSYMEIYNERIFDLLATHPEAGEYAIVEDRVTHSMTVKGLTYKHISSEEEALDMLFQGDQRRTTASHQLNKSSNRSHSIYTLSIEQQSRVRSENVVCSKLHLVDLAGSERLKKAIEVEGAVEDSALKKESMYINKSLTYLEQVVVALTAKAGSRHVPYRQCKLTNVLKDSLGGNCNTVLCACIWGEARHLEETISTLKLAQRMMGVQNEATSNVQSNPALQLQRYERQIRELKQELMMHDVLANRSGVAYDEYTPEQSREVAQQVREFVDMPVHEEESSSVFQLRSVRQIHEILKQFKLLVLNVESTVEERLRAQFALKPRADGLSGVADGSAGAQDKNADGTAENLMVGEVDAQAGGFGLGTAARTARPNTLDVVGNAMASSPSAATLNPDGSPVAGGGGASPGSFGNESKYGGGFNDEEPVPANKEEAFAVFKRSTAGMDTSMEIERLKRETDELKRMRASTRAEMKMKQDEKSTLKARLDDKRAEQKSAESKLGGDTGDEELIIDEEEFRTMQDIQACKKAIKALSHKYTEIDEDYKHVRDQQKAMEKSLLDVFTAWFAEKQASADQALDDDGDVLDDGEQFDKLEIERVMAEDPESLAFFSATKRQRVRARKAPHRSTRKRG